MAPRVFISSVMDGFEDFRDAATEAVEAAGAIAVRVEALTSDSRSPRNACFDLVESADIYMVIVGARGGWTAPSGKCVTEEEYDHARSLGRPVLAFLQDTSRDRDATRLAAAVSHYVSGHFRTTFTDRADLRRKAQQAISELLPTLARPMTNPNTVNDAALAAEPLLDETTLRVVVAPEREIELVDVLDLESDSLKDGLFAVGHDPSVRIFAYEKAKATRYTRTAVILEQTTERGVPGDLVRLSLSTTGLLALDISVTGSGRRVDPHLIHQLAIVEENVRSALLKGFRMINAVLGVIDEHERCDRLLLNACVVGVGHRTWFRDSTPKSGMPMRMSDPRKECVTEAPRRIGRSELKSPEELVDRYVALLRRQLEER